MAIQITCQCGKSYKLKDEFAGRLVECPQCGGSLRVDPTQEAAKPAYDAAFNRDKFLLRQKLLSISQKYYVWDEEGNTVLFIERPANFLRNAFALLVAAITAIAVIILFFGLAAALGEGALSGLLLLIGIPGGIVAALAVGVALSQKRHVTFYRDDTKRERLLEVLQDQKFEFLTATYTVNDAQGKQLAKFRKNYLYDIFRKRWNCYTPDGATLCVAKEDSIILALLRRVLGTFYGLLRVNFVIFRGTSEQVLGEFNRKFTLLDRYVLDMTPDAKQWLDRRVAIALGVMLDTGERR